MPKFLPRTLASTLGRALKSFPTVVVTGPRQSGKTTMLRESLGGGFRFETLEDPDVRQRAAEDPRAFLESVRTPAVLDEIQYAPGLLPYLKTVVDADRKPGRWILTGSQSFPLMQGVSESLAGRAAVLQLLPLSLAERAELGSESSPPSLRVVDAGGTGKTGRLPSLEEWILGGGYPEPAANPDVVRKLWFSSYLATYLERDVRQVTQVGDLVAFQVFLRACAARTAQIFDQSDLARDIGVSVPTVKRWFSVLEAGGIACRLPPYYRNVGKRLVKSPKLYFLDTGLAAHLLGIHDTEVLRNGPSFGPLFETALVADWVKRFLHHGETPSVWYLRTRDGLEADLAVEAGGRLHLFEAKTTMTPMPRHGEALSRWRRDLGELVASASLVLPVEEEFPLSRDVRVLPWKRALVP